MDYGIAQFPTDYSIAPAALAVAAEERGFESFWAPEHSHIPWSRKSPWPGGADLPKQYYDVMDPFLALASAATATSRIKLGTGICLVVQRDPIYTAKAVSTARPDFERALPVRHRRRLECGRDGATMAPTSRRALRSWRSAWRP